MESGEDLQGQIAEVIERRDDGQISVRFGNRGLLFGQEAGSFERIAELGLKAKK